MFVQEEREGREREREREGREREREGDVRCESTAVCMSVCHNGCSFDKIRSRTHTLSEMYTYTQ